jgi:hypothetical protein
MTQEQIIYAWGIVWMCGAVVLIFLPIAVWLTIDSIRHPDHRMLMPTPQHKKSEAKANK